MATPRSRGVVLVVVLWLLVAMALAGALVIAWTHERIAEAQRSRDATADAIDIVGTRDTLLFLASTIPTTRAGLPAVPATASEIAARRLDEFGGLDRSPRGREIPLDGSTLRGLGDVWLQAQDESGLVGLGVLLPQRAAALLVASGASRDAGSRLAGPLADALSDYADPDDLRRLAGAERREYQRLGLAPPAGRPLLAPSELRGVYGWRSLDARVRDRAVDLSTTAYSGALNLNTAPAELLGALALDCRERCRARIAARGESPFEDGLQFQQQTGIALPGDPAADYRVAPSDALRLTLAGRTGRAWRMHVRLTPLADRTGPWTVEAAYRMPRPTADDAPATIQSPLFAAAPMD